MKLSRQVLVGVFLGLAFVVSCTSKENNSAPSDQSTAQVPSVLFEKAKMKVADKEIEVEVALTSLQHERGLMFRETLTDNTGMLFIFSGERTLSFWMKNTYIDLDIAYINAEKTIVDIQQMAATAKGDESEPPSYPSAKPAQYALEMAKGWFAKNNIKVGDKVTLP